MLHEHLVPAVIVAAVTTVLMFVLWFHGAGMRTHSASADLSAVVTVWLHGAAVSFAVLSVVSSNAADSSDAKSGGGSKKKGGGKGGGESEKKGGKKGGK